MSRRTRRTDRGRLVAAAAGAVAAAAAGVVALRRRGGGGGAAEGSGTSTARDSTGKAAGGEKKPGQSEAGGLSRIAGKLGLGGTGGPALPGTEAHCACGQAFRVSGQGRHRVVWLPDAAPEDPLLDHHCPNCGEELALQV